MSNLKVNGSLEFNSIAGGGLTALLDKIYPVGSIYLSTNSTSPASFLGGDWVQIKDKFLLASGDTYTSGTTGGEASHTHSLGNGYARAYGDSDKWYWVEKGGVDYWAGWSTNAGRNSWSLQKHYYGTSLGGNTDTTSTLPPYLVVNVWQRTA